MLDVEARCLVGALDPVIAATVEIPGVIGLGALVLEDGQSLARLKRPSARAGLAAQTENGEGGESR